jgi:glycosyltransferase involved in cell wall biosynthesis
MMFLTGRKVIKKYRNEVDLVVTFNPTPWGIVAWIIAKLYKKKIVLGYIGNDFTAIQYWPVSALIRYVTEKSDIVTGTGEHMIKGFSTLNIDRSRLIVYPHCLSDDFFEDQDSTIPIQFDLVTLCELIPRKRVGDVLEALLIARDKYGVLLRLCIIGDGPDFQFLRRKVEEYQLNDQVFFAGFTTEIKPLLRSAKIFVQASSLEGLSLALIEAMGLGLIPITTIAGSEKDIITDDENGLFVPIAEPEMLAEKILYALKPENYIRLKQGVFKSRDQFRGSRAIEAVDKILDVLFFSPADKNP